MTLGSWMDGWLNTHKYIMWKPTSQSWRGEFAVVVSVKGAVNGTHWSTCYNCRRQKVKSQPDLQNYAVLTLNMKWCFVWLSTSSQYSQWPGQGPVGMVRGCICCCCHSYPLTHSPLIRCLDSCDLETHCWWSDITQAEATLASGVLQA